MVAIWEDGATESPRSAMDYASALPAAQRDAPHASHAKSGKVFASFMQPSEARHTPEAGQGRLKIPTLRLGDQEIAERLHARHRFQLFRIDKIGVERLCFGLAEQLHQPAVLLDQVVGQHGDAEAALAGAQ